MTNNSNKISKRSRPRRRSDKSKFLREIFSELITNRQIDMNEDKVMGKFIAKARRNMKRPCNLQEYEKVYNKLVKFTELGQNVMSYEEPESEGEADLELDEEINNNE